VRADRRLRPHDLRGRRRPPARRPGLDDLLPAAAVFRPGRRPRGRPPAPAREEGRPHGMPPPKTEVGDELDLEPLPPKEKDPEGLKQWEALEADARFAHVLPSGPAHTA